MPRLPSKADPQTSHRYEIALFDAQGEIDQPGYRRQPLPFIQVSFQARGRWGTIVGFAVYDRWGNQMSRVIPLDKAQEVAGQETVLLSIELTDWELR